MQTTTASRIEVVGGMVEDLDNGLVHLNDLDVTWGFGLDTFWQQRRRQEPAAANASDGKAKMIGPSQGGAVNASSAPAGGLKVTSAGHQLSTPTKGPVRIPA